MALFEVFIPGKESGMPNVTLTVEAQNWIGALRSGLQTIGEGQESIANVMCDIKEDNTIHVSDVATQRVFRLREIASKLVIPPIPTESASPSSLPSLPDPPTISEGPRRISMDEDDDQTLDNRGLHKEDPTLDTVGLLAADAARQAQPKTLVEFPLAVDEQTLALPLRPAAPRTQTPAPMAPSIAPAPGVYVAQDSKVASPPPPAAPPPAAVVAPVAAPAPKAAAQPTSKAPKAGAPSQHTPRGVPVPGPKRPSGQFSSATAPVTRAVTAPHSTDPRIGRVPTADKGRAGPMVVQDAIAAVFDATQDLYMEPALSAQHLADKLLDIALLHIPADAGSFYLADVNGHELVFAAVRGPKAEALKKSGVTVKVGQGIIGFCAQEGVCLVVNDIQKDPRFFSALAKTIDYQPRDTLCASAEKEGRLWGAVQLINSKAGFEAAHMEVLRFIGLTAASMLERIDDRSGG